MASEQGTWVVVAHREGARVLEMAGDEKPRVLETLVEPGRRSRDEAGADEARESQRGNATRTFAATIADKLQRGRLDKRFADLVLIAAPRFLGVLREALDPATAALVRGTLDKDYAGLNDRDLIARLEKM